MKKTFISFIVALSVLVYSLCGFSVFADATPSGNTEGLSRSISDSSGKTQESILKENTQDTQLRSFDGTNADGTLDISKGISTNIVENASKYNGMATVETVGMNVARSRYSNTRVALSPDISDTKYAEAAELLGALGIMVGDAESGAFRPDDAILRSEMAKVAVYSIGLEDIVKSSASQTKFPDVPNDHWATGAINVADRQGLVVGDTEGTFRPDDSVTNEEAVTIIVRALGYEPAAQDKGGYPSGYMSIASQKQLLKGIDAAASEPAKRGDIAQLVFNAMTVNMMEQVGFGSTVSYEEVDKTLLYDRLNVEKAYGQVKSSDETSLSGTSVVGDGKVQIGESIYQKGDTNAAQLLGYNVLYYARIDKTTDEKTIILISPQSNKNNSLSLNSSDIVEVSGDEGANKTVEYWANKNTDRRTKTAAIKQDAVYIYNGKYKSDVTISQLKPTSGNLTLIDADMDNVYETVFVNHFSNLVVDTISEVTGRVTDKYLNGSLVFDENTNPDVKYTITKDGAEISIKDLHEWNVISYTVSEDKNLIRAYVSDASVTGTVTEISDEGYKIGDSDVIYEKAESYPNEISLRDKGTFYLDIEDKIAAVNTKGVSESESSENYAYLVDAATKTEFGTTAQFKIFTKDGETKVLEGTQKMRVNDDYAQSAENVIAHLSNGTIVTPQLIIYETNSDGLITAIDTAKDNTQSGEPNTAEFTKNISKAGMIYKRASGKLGNVGISDDTIIFDIPSTAGSDTDKYSIRNKSTLSNDSSYDAIIYDLQENYTANAMIITSSTGITNAESPITVVNFIAEIRNEDYEYTDKLYGYSEGKEVELTAADKSVFIKSGQTKLKAGDIIQYKTNAKGEVDGITVLFDSASKTQEFDKSVTDDLRTVYGRVTKKFSGSVNVAVGDETYNFGAGDATVYLYDSSKSKNSISVVSAADIEIYEEGNEARLFVKIYQDEVQEMVIVR